MNIKLITGAAFGIVMAAGSLQAQGVRVDDVFYSVFESDMYTGSSATYTVNVDPYNSFVLGQFSGAVAIRFSPLWINPTEYVSLSGMQLTTDNSVAQNTDIGPGSVFNSDNYIPGYDAIYGYYTFGMKLSEPNGKSYYGWIEFDQTGTWAGQCYTQITYFYNNTGADVFAQDYIVPEPSSAGLLGVGALLAGSVSVWKRRQQKSNA